MEIDGRFRIILIVSAAVAGFALLLLIISVGTVLWLDDGVGNSVGLFRKCNGNAGIGCYNENQITQGGLSIFGLLLLVFAIATILAAMFLRKQIILYVALGLLYFSSMFIMAAYATWGTYSREPNLYAFPIPADTNAHHTAMGSSYHLCVAAHYFLWTALTVLAVGVGYALRGGTATN